MATILVIALLITCFCCYMLGKKKVINRIKDIEYKCNNNAERFYDRIFNEFLK